MLKLYGVVGKKLSHTFSPRYFNQKFERERLYDYHYKAFELSDITEIKMLLNSNPELQGFNVTVPYKEEIIPFLSSISPEAEAIGAVNVVKIIYTQKEAKLYGYNTDIFGFENSLKPLLQTYHKKALILGTGGAAKAIAFVLRKLGIDFLFVSRNTSNILNTITYTEITKKIAEEYLLVINATPVGMFPEIGERPDYPFQYASEEHLFYDLIYNPEKTLFLIEAEKQEASIKNGLEMLHLQANKAWEIFFNPIADS